MLYKHGGFRNDGALRRGLESPLGGLLQREYQKWFSPNLGRDMEFLWFGHSGQPWLMFPTSLGRFFQYEDMGTIQALAGPIEEGRLQVLAVDSVDAESWYNNHAAPGDRAWRHELYDRYIRREILPHIHHRTQREDLGVFGASFGAYHAANIAARYPEMVAAAVLFSGVFDTRRFLEGFWNDTCYFHCPAAYIPNMDETWVSRLSKVHWVIATGEHDHLVEENHRFADTLRAKSIPNHLEIWPGVFGHDWPFWNDHIRRFLPHS